MATIHSQTAAGNRSHEDLLLPSHREHLTAGSGIAPEVIAERDYRSMTPPNGQPMLRAYGFSPIQAKQVPGLLLPLWTTDGRQALMAYRPDQPRTDTRGRCIKYEIPKDASVRVDCPPRCHPLLADPAIPLWVTEGQKKADALASRGVCAVALLGVWNFKGKNAFGTAAFLADWDYIAWDQREVRIVFDSDIMFKHPVRMALDRLTEHLRRKGARVATVYLPHEGGHKMGVDDYLLAHSIQDLEGLLERPRPLPRVAPPTVELLAEAPKGITRPLALIDGRAYAATWLWTRTTSTEMLTKAGEVVRLPEPQITEDRRLFIVRDDGQLFGEVSDPQINPWRDLGITVHLPEIPPDSRLWSASSVRQYRLGRRATPREVFTRIVDVVNRFIDFDHSLADQRTMCEMVGCYILSTWLLDAFTVIGFLWPNGDRGSGKTQLLALVTELGYLGQTILAGGSFAALRDLADYGACLAFDDAEQLNDPRRADPDKRALLLAGNRRGNTVPVKEPGPQGTWRTRYINTFCPRLFSAIRLPDPILASRSIVVPLIRTADRERANADPLDYTLWPHDRDKLRDELWTMALAHLPAFPPYVAQVNTRATLSGRTLEPWRPLLAVARWLEDAGVEGLWTRMETLSVTYQQERPDLETADLTTLVIRALCHCATRAKSATIREEKPGWAITTAEVCLATLAMASEWEITIDREQMSPTRVGRVLARLRLQKIPRAGGHGSRKWWITLNDLDHWTTVYSLSLPDALGREREVALVAHPNGHQVSIAGMSLSASGAPGSYGPSGTLDMTSAEPLTPRPIRVRAGRPRRARRRPLTRSGRVPLLEGGILRFPLDVDAGGFSTSS